jgi:uncharacterized protein
MARESALTLNPRVSILEHGSGLYLFDPVTRSCASLNHAMLALLRDPAAVDPRGNLPAVVGRLRSLGILIGPEASPALPFDGFGPPSRLHIFVTSKCNLRCAYCYAAAGEARSTIDASIWRPAMDHFFRNLGPPAKVREVNLTLHGGGEPTVEFATLREIVAEFQARAGAAGMRPTVIMGSNGTYGDKVHRWIVDNDVDLSVSLDGPEAVQNRLRPYRSSRPSYGKVVRNLEALVAAGRRVSVRATITEQSVDSMEETVELARQLGLAAVHFEPVTISGRAVAGEVARPDAERFGETFLRCFLRGLKHDINVKYSGLHCLGRYRQRFCSACGHNFCVTPNGNVTTCYEVLDADDPAADIFFVGRIGRISGQVVRDRSRIERLKARTASNMQACAGCFLRYQCAGDCPIKCFRRTGSIFSPDPYRCGINRHINKTIIAWLADGVIEPRHFDEAQIISSGPEIGDRHDDRPDARNPPRHS